MLFFIVQNRSLMQKRILGGSIMAAMSVRKVRTLEQSQISYSNLQAHELRTPLHQILAITQLLRSQMTDLADTPTSHPQNSLTTMQQIRDLLPYLDAIDTSGKTLHGIVDNILSFLDLKGKDNMLMPSTPGLMTSPSGAASSLEVMFEELIDEACEEDKRVRVARGQPPSNVETIFEIVPPLLGEQVTEDAGGALRKALSKILSNAYKFIESQGCVEIYVDDVAYRRPPEGCEDLSLTKMISIVIVDSGKGMDDDFVKEKLGEPWAKEDPFATGSGLSVHLAWRIIDLMGGDMEISSTPDGGCTVKIEVPVPKRKVSVPNSPESAAGDKLHGNDPAHLASHPDHFKVERQVALLGYDFDDGCVWGLPRLGKVLRHSFVKLGCQMTSLEDAEVVVLDGRMEEADPSAGERSLYYWLDKIGASDIVILVSEDHEAHPDVIARERELGKRIRRYRKPITPTILREILFPNHAQHVTAEIETEQGTIEQSINSPDKIDSHGNEMNANGTPKNSIRFDEDTINVTRPCRLKSAMSSFSQLWKPKGMEVEEAVASLCLGDYFSSRRKGSLARTVSNGSASSRGKSTATTPTLASGEFSETTSVSTPATSMLSPLDDTPNSFGSGFEEPEPVPEPEPERIKVLVVEDNMINRKILVKILSTKLHIDVVEAEDGAVAVDLFRDLTSPVIGMST
jgi:signal transduction histidine kinase